MLVISENALRNIMSTLVSATHGLTDKAGNLKHIGTVDEKTLRNAALAALLLVSNDVVVTPAALP